MSLDEEATAPSRRGLLRANLAGLVDHALISGTSVLTLVLLARQLGSRSFGTFVLAYTALLLANTVQTALLTQPHNVLGAAREGLDYVRYTSSVAVAQLVFSCLTVLVVGSAALVARSFGSSLSTILVAAIPAAVGWQLQEFFRRVLYTEGKIVRALVTDVVSYGGQIAALVAAAAAGMLTARFALLAIGGSSLLAALPAAIWLRRSFRLTFDRECISRTWRFGSWLAAAMVVGALAVHVYIYLVAGVAGSASAGGLKAAQVLLGPLNVVLIFLNTILPIRFSRLLHTTGAFRLPAAMRSVLALAIPVVGIYCVAVSVLARQALEAAYGSEYRGYDTLVVLMAAYTFLSLFAFVFAAALSALEQTRAIFYGNALGALVSLVFGYPLVVWLGATGGGIGMLIGLVCAVGLYGRSLRSEGVAMPVPAH